MINAIKAEKIKLRHSRIVLAILGMPVIPAFLGTLNYKGNIGILTPGWHNLWTQHTLFMYYFFMPAMIAIICSYLFRLEHLNHNWNNVLVTPQPVWRVYVSKLVWAVIFMFILHVWIGGLFIGAGLLIGIHEAFPVELVLWLLTAFAGTIAICALQLTMALVIRSFAVPTAIALAGGIIGLLAVSKGFGSLIPYALPSIGARANNPTADMAVSGPEFAVSCILFTITFSVAAIALLKRRK